MSRAAVFAAFLFLLVSSVAGERGDVIHLQTLTGISVDGCQLTDSVSDGVLWDFTQAQRLDQVSARYYGRGDSVVMELMPQLMRCRN